MRTKSTLLIILMVFLSHNHSTLGQSIIPHWEFARIFTLCNSMCNSIFAPIKTRLARIGGIFSAILYRKQSVVNMEEIEPIKDDSTTLNVPEQSEYENLQQQLENLQQQLKEENKQVLSIFDKHTKKEERTLLLGYGSIAAFHGLGKTPVPQLMAHYTRFELASILPVIKSASPFAFPALALITGIFAAWKVRCIMRSRRKKLQTKLDKITTLFNNELTKIGSNYLLTYGHPNCDINIKASGELSQRHEDLSKQTQSALTNLERLKDHNYTEESEKNNFNSTKQLPTEICALMASAKKEDEKITK